MIPSPLPYRQLPVVLVDIVFQRAAKLSEPASHVLGPKSLRDLTAPAIFIRVRLSNFRWKPNWFKVNLPRFCNHLRCSSVVIMAFVT